MFSQFQTTIRKPVEVHGVGLHSGADVSLRILPAPASTGIVFRRTDLDGFEIPAHWKYIARVSYATSLMRQGVLLSTTEHLLSTLYGMGVDNAFLDIDNLEAPILDGSAAPFAELIERAGVKKLRRERRFLRIVHPVEVREGDKRVSISPYEGFRIHCETDYGHPLAGPQRFDADVDPIHYSRWIAPARTFGFQSELDRMRDMGLIRGASLDNAVCFTEDGVLNPGGLRFPDECCRHKVLDLIGDLALLGLPLMGSVVAERAGHAIHAALVTKIMRDPMCYEVVGSRELDSELVHAVAG